MRELSNNQILEYLKQDTIGRNEQLSVLVKLLNSMSESTVLAVDGAWGSGKTVFVKQLLMLADVTVDDYGRNSIDHVAVEKLREKQKTFYFNAWENDYIGDALGAILLKLIASGDESLNAASIRRGLAMVNMSAGIKNITHDFVDFSADTRKDKLVKDVRARIDRHDAVNEFIDKLKGSAERLVVVVDELDRCRPSFAIDFLEVIKHYFVRDDITFIIATNIKELSHTVQKFYGYSSDGYSYLNKFFDFTIGLRRVNIDDYARVLDWQAGSRVVDGLAQDAADYYGFEMREVNAYYSAMRLIDRFLRRDNAWSEDQYPVQLVFVPLALALRVKNSSYYTEFVTGRGENILRDFMPHTLSGLHYVERLVPDRTGLTQDQIKEKGIDALVTEYHNLFVPEGRRRGRENLNDFRDAISLISSYTTIPEIEVEE